MGASGRTAAAIARMVRRLREMERKPKPRVTGAGWT
jgi:hypothetical protein